MARYEFAKPDQMGADAAAQAVIRIFDAEPLTAKQWREVLSMASAQRTRYRHARGYTDSWRFDDVHGLAIELGRVLRTDEHRVPVDLADKRIAR
jgi:hypothetical protein